MNPRTRDGLEASREQLTRHVLRVSKHLHNDIDLESIFNLLYRVK